MAAPQPVTLQQQDPPRTLFQTPAQALAEQRRPFDSKTVVHVLITLLALAVTWGGIRADVSTLKSDVRELRQIVVQILQDGKDRHGEK